MAAKTVGALIKEARTSAGLTQEALAKKVTNASASDIGKAERGEKELTQAQLKEIAKATGVTQASLINAAKCTTSAAKKTNSSSSKKTSASSKTGSTAKKTTSSSSKKSDELTLTATEKKLVELYRAADSDTKKKAVSILKGETPEAGDILSSLIGGAIDLLGKK